MKFVLIFLLAFGSVASADSAVPLKAKPNRWSYTLYMDVNLDPVVKSLVAGALAVIQKYDSLGNSFVELPTENLLEVDFVVKVVPNANINKNYFKVTSFSRLGISPEVQRLLSQDSDTLLLEKNSASALMVQLEWDKISQSLDARGNLQLNSDILSRAIVALSREIYGRVVPYLRMGSKADFAGPSVALTDKLRISSYRESLAFGERVLQTDLSDRTREGLKLALERERGYLQIVEAEAMKTSMPANVVPLRAQSACALSLIKDDKT